MNSTDSHSSSRPDRRPASRWLTALGHGIPALLVLLLPWLLGGQLLEVQTAALAMAALAWVISLPLKQRAVRIPVGLLLLLTAYVLIQYFNPAFIQTWQTGLRIWNLKPVEYIHWLPSSIDSDFTDSSPLRFLVVYVTAALCGLTLYQMPGRFSRKWLPPMIALGATMIALVGLIQVNLGSRSILGIFDAADKGLGLFFGTLLYKNHAAAFFNLGLAASLSCYFAFKRTSRNRRSNPSWLFLVMAAVLLAGVIFSRSRFGFLCSLGILGVFLPLAFRSALQAGMHKRGLVLVGIAFLLLLGGGGFYLFKNQGAKHLQTLTTEITQDFSYKQRMIAYRSELEMFAAKPLYGWGAGNYRHGFRMFQNVEREQAELGNAYMERKNKQFFWQHAHNDYLEWLIELGVVGTLILVSVPGYFFLMIFKSKRWKEPTRLLLLCGLGGTLLHAWVDFPFRNPAVLVTWAALLVIAAGGTQAGKESAEENPGYGPIKIRSRKNELRPRIPDRGSGPGLPRRAGSFPKPPA